MKNKDGSPPINTGWLIQAALDRGVERHEISDVLAGAVESESLWDRLPFISYLRLFNWLTERLGDPQLGLHLSEEVDVSAFGGGSLMLYHASNLRDCFTCLAQYDQTMSAALSIEYFEDEHGGRLEYRMRAPLGTDLRQDDELTMGMLVNFFRQHLGEGWLPERIDFAHAVPECTDKYHSYFSESIYFDQPVTAIYLRPSELDVRINNADPYLLEVLREHADDLQQRVLQKNSFLAQVRHYIARSVGSDLCTAEWAAERLFMSRRNLTRRLQAQGVNFRSLRNEITIEMAKRALLDTSSKISDIALQLGYSESSAFDRAFKKIVGYSPSNYRQQAQRHASID